MGPAPKITWKKRRDKDWDAWVGSLLLGFVIVRDDGTVAYSVDAIHTRRLTKGHGEVSSVRQGKASMTRAWEAWWSMLEGEPRW